MGMFTFSLPPNLAPEVMQDLEKACVTGGPDAMPTMCRVLVEPMRLVIGRDADESGSVQAPWLVQGAGHLVVQTATLVERQDSYSLPLELSRGKINQLRNQFSDWVMGGLDVPPPLAQNIRE